MDSLDLEVLQTCEKWRLQQRPCQLLTVVKTWGSSPRPVGAMAVLAHDGQLVGSVSGGCIEDDLIARIREQETPYKREDLLPQLISYGLTSDAAHRFGLPCGGSLQLVCEPITEKSRIAELLANIHQARLVQRQLVLATGAVTLSPANQDAALHINDSVLTSIHGPRWRILIIGAGQLSRFFAKIAHSMDYQVTICDPREEYNADWDTPAIQLVTTMPDDAVIAMRPDCRSAIIALTHDPKLDDLALMEALKSDAFYVGALGSRSNQEKRRARLRLFDLSQAQIDRLHGPVGLSIGSKTPAEIAISILAELTAYKNRSSAN